MKIFCILKTVLIDSLYCCNTQTSLDYIYIHILNNFISRVHNITYSNETRRARIVEELKKIQINIANV